MRRINLRQQPRISYCEPEEPNWDQYIFCEKCGDYVYEYCSIHGPLIAIPDNKVPAKSPYPPYVPKAALTIPNDFLHIARSIIPGAGLGIFSTLALPRGIRFGPYSGIKTTTFNSMYCWQIYDNDHKPSHVIDASDANRSNWMRYVNCSRHWSEQNLVAYQYNGELYYRTVRVIPRFTELMVFYGSEFAYLLDIDLSLYNLPVGYTRKSRALTKKRKSDDVPQKTKQINLAETTKKKKTSNDAFKILTNERKVLDTDFSKNKPTPSDTTDLKSPHEVTRNTQTVNSVVNCNQTNNNLLKNNILPNDKTIISKTCCNNAENDAIVIAPSTSLDKSDKENKINIINKMASENNYACHIIQHECVTKCNLNKHLRKHTIEKPYICDLCEYRCTRKYYLKRHIQYKHTKEKNFRCRICEYKCVTKSDLTIHLRKHTGEKPYVCNLCDYRCSLKNNLKKHVQFKHTKEKNFRCHICEYKCVRKNDLTIHLRKHTGEKPYVCNLCDYRCSLKNNLKSHIQSKHTK